MTRMKTTLTYESQYHCLEFRPGSVRLEPGRNRCLSLEAGERHYCKLDKCPFFHEVSPVHHKDTPAATIEIVPLVQRKSVK